MATVITRYVNTNSSGGDGTTNATSGGTAAYATLSAAITDILADYPDFVTSDVQVSLLCGGTSADTGGFPSTFNATCDSTRYLHIQPNGSGQRASASGYQTDRYRFEATLAVYRGWVLQSHGTIVEGLQWKITRTYAASDDGGLLELFTLYSATKRAQVVHGNRIEVICNTASAAAFDVINSKGDDMSDGCYNNLVLISGSEVGTIRGLSNGSSNAGGFWYNNTVAGAGTGFVGSTGGGKTKAINNAAVSCTTGYTTSANFTASSNNASTNSTPPGTSPQSSVTVAYVNTGTGDYRTASGDTGLRDVGTDLSAAGTYPFSVDIENVTRSGTWDIGAYEYVGTSTFFRPYFITG